MAEAFTALIVSLSSLASVCLGSWLTWRILRDGERFIPQRTQEEIEDLPLEQGEEDRSGNEPDDLPDYDDGEDQLTMLEQLKAGHQEINESLT